jgi:hypothetical protein
MPDRIEIIAKQLVGRANCQQEGVHDLHDSTQRGMRSTARQVGDEIFGDDFAPFGGETISFIRRFMLAKQRSKMT